jgi:IS605 OrfB family transposase
MQRTIRLQLYIATPRQAEILLKTLQDFTFAFNFVCQYGWENEQRNGVTLHHQTYYIVKDKLKELPSQLVCTARVKATETLKSVFALRKLYPAKLKAFYQAKVEAEKKGKPFKRKMPNPPRCPGSANCPIRYDQRSYWVDWAKQRASLATVDGRQILEFTIPPYAQKYAGYPVDSADLIYRNGRFWLHVVVTLPDPIPVESGEVIGVDLGLNHPAVTSKRKFLGSKHWKEIDRRNFRLKRALQSKGTKSAKRHLKKLAGRLIRFRRDCDHVLSKRIIQSATVGATIVIENLTEIRNTSNIKRKTQTSRRLHSWSFAQFRAFLTYKAQEAGIKLVAIDPRYTSQTCSKCSFQSRSNRRTQALFFCKRCAYCLNADLNASYNICNKHLATLGITLGSGLQSIGLTYQAPA